LDRHGSRNVIMMRRTRRSLMLFIIQCNTIKVRSTCSLFYSFFLSFFDDFFDDFLDDFLDDF